jgi:hypothetical protein
MNRTVPNLSSVFRIALGVVAALFVCYCGFLVLTVWFLFPKWPGNSLRQDLEFRVAMTLGCTAAGVGGIYLAGWCFFRNDSGNESR